MSPYSAPNGCRAPAHRRQALSPPPSKQCCAKHCFSLGAADAIGAAAIAIAAAPAAKDAVMTACHNGETPYQASTDLEAPAGPYTFDDVNAIASAATVIYCPWHNAALPPN